MPAILAVNRYPVDVDIENVRFQKANGAGRKRRFFAAFLKRYSKDILITVSMAPWLKPLSQFAMEQE